MLLWDAGIAQLSNNNHTWTPPNNKATKLNLNAGGLWYRWEGILQKRNCNKSNNKLVAELVPSSAHITVLHMPENKSPFRWRWQKYSTLQPHRGILRFWTGTAELDFWNTEKTSTQLEVSLKKHLISFKYRLNKFRSNGLFWAIFLQSYRDVPQQP